MSQPTYHVRIKDTVTGVVRECPQTTPWDSSTIFWWQEGSYSCDCNRELEFLRTGDEPLPAQENDFCLGHCRYRVESIRLLSGEVLPFDDFRFEGAK